MHWYKLTGIFNFGYSIWVIIYSPSWCMITTGALDSLEPPQHFNRGRFNLERYGDIAMNYRTKNELSGKSGLCLERKRIKTCRRWRKTCAWQHFIQSKKSYRRKNQKAGEAHPTKRESCNSCHHSGCSDTVVEACLHVTTTYILRSNDIFGCGNVIVATSPSLM